VNRSGTVFVAVAVAAICAYLGYQIWVNPTRKIQRRLGELAARLSVAEHEPDMARIARLAGLRGFFAPDVRIRVGATEIVSRDAVLGAASGVTPPPGGADVQVVDLQVRFDGDTGTTAMAFMKVEVVTPDPRSHQPTVDSRDATVNFALRDGEWMVTAADVRNPPREP